MTRCDCWQAAAVPVRRPPLRSLHLTIEPPLLHRQSELPNYPARTEWPAHSCSYSLIPFRTLKDEAKRHRIAAFDRLVPMPIDRAMFAWPFPMAGTVLVYRKSNFGPEIRELLSHFVQTLECPRRGKGGDSDPLGPGEDGGYSRDIRRWPRISTKKDGKNHLIEDRNQHYGQNYPENSSVKCRCIDFGEWILGLRHHKGIPYFGIGKT